MALQAAVGHPEGTRRKPVPVRIRGDQREGAGWPEFAGSESVAVAGATGSSGAGLQSMGKLVEGLSGLLESR